CLLRASPSSTLCPYTTLFRSDDVGAGVGLRHGQGADVFAADQLRQVFLLLFFGAVAVNLVHAQVGMGTVREANGGRGAADFFHRSEEHTSELQSRENLVCRLL